MVDRSLIAVEAHLSVHPVEGHEHSVGERQGEVVTPLAAVLAAEDHVEAVLGAGGDVGEVEWRTAVMSHSDSAAARSGPTPFQDWGPRP